MLRNYLDAFWNEAFWLPNNVTWTDVDPGPGKAVAYTDYRYIVLALPIGLVLTLLRFTLDKYAYAPLGRALGIKETRKKQVPLNDTLEAAYKANPALNKGVTQDVCWYYMLQTAFYWSQMFTLLWDVRRKDFLQMVIHHLTTIALLSFSWVCNLHRIGTLFSLLSDGVETLLEMAKAAKYAGYKKFADGVFALFTVTWVITRLCIYPFHILRSTTFRASMYLDCFPAYYMLGCFCYVLMALNIFWTWLIFKVLFNMIKTGHVERDIRSSSSDNDSSQSDHDNSDQSPQLFGNAPADQVKLAKNEEALKILGTFLEAEEPCNKYTIS